MAFPSTGILLDPSGLGNAGPPPSGSFTTSVGAGLKIASGKIAPNATNDYQGAAWTSAFSADMEAHVRIATVPTVDGTITLGCLIRLQSASNQNADHYEICLNRQAAANDKLELYRIASSGTYTWLTSFTLSGEIQVNDQIGIAAYGSLIVGFYNGTPVITARDTVVSAGGCAAMMYYINGMGEFGAFGGGNVARTLRLYLPSSGAPAISPAFDAAWGDTEDADRIAAVSSPSNTAMTDKTCDEAVSTNPLNVLARQYIYGPLTAGWKVEGVVRGVIRCLESNSAADFMAALKIRGVDSAGANPSTLLDISTAALSNELGTSAASRLFPRNWTSPILTPWTVPSGGGYLVIEVGVRSVNSSTTNRTATLRFGDTTSNSDRTEDETATDDLRPWIEFSDVGAVSTIADRDGSAAGAATATGQSGPTQGRVASASGMATASGASAARQGRTGASSASATVSGESADASLLENCKIAPPSSGIYFGQYSWDPDGQDIPTVEAAVGIRTAYYSPLSGNWANGAMSYVSGHPVFDPDVADAVWAQGRVVIVQAYNLTANPDDDEHPTGFTIDQLLDGAYDTQLAAFAAQLRDFGKPVWFINGRETQGVELPWMGGWGPDGDQNTEWAITNSRAYNEFVPPSPPSGARADLYAGCSGATMPDGIGRVKAGQHYIHDFMVRREGLHFLTFDTMGFACQFDIGGTDTQAHYNSQDYTGFESYALTLFQRCNDPANWLPDPRCYDWVSVTLYTLDYYDDNWGWLSGSDILVATEDWITTLDNWMAAIASVTSRPIHIIELGCPDGMDSRTTYGAEKITAVFNAILDDYPQIKAVSLWSNLDAADGGWFEATNVDDAHFPYDCLIRTGPQATALQAVIAAHPGEFHSYIQLTNGDTLSDGLAARDGTGAGVGTASGVSADLEARTGSGVGTGSAPGQSGATEGRAGTGAGSGAATGQSGTTVGRAAEADGTSAASAESTEIASRTGAGTGAATGQGVPGQTVGVSGSSTGQAESLGESADAAAAGEEGTSAGQATATGQSARIDQQTVSADGASDADGRSAAMVGRDGTAPATAQAVAQAAAVQSAAGLSDGLSAASGAGGKTATASGTSAGQAEAIGAPLLNPIRTTLHCSAEVAKDVTWEIFMAETVELDVLVAASVHVLMEV